VIWVTKKMFISALSHWCYKPVQSMAYHSVFFMHHVRSNVLISVTLKMTVFWNLQPCSLVELYRSARLHGFTSQKSIFTNLVHRYLTELLGCKNTPLQGLYMTTHTHKRQRHTTRPQVELNPTTPVFEMYKTVRL
jgi:hypothetical protein